MLHFLPYRFQHWLRLLFSTRYRYEWKELRRLSSLPLRTSSATNLLGNTLNLNAAPLFPSRYKEFFIEQRYFFKTDKVNPYIIDAGANIGLTTIYFKKLFPEARITAFEADPTIFETLRSNCKSFGLQNVELVNKAVWVNNNGCTFHSSQGTESGRIESFSEAGHIGPKSDPFFIEVEVDTCRLRDYLADVTVDLLKIDIEGAETDVLKDCRDVLKNVNLAIIEYHSFKDKEQTLHVILDILAKAHFRVYLETIVMTQYPLINPPKNDDTDLNVNIFAYRSR